MAGTVGKSSTQVSLRYIAATSIALVVAHWLIWLLVAFYRSAHVVDLLNHWDSGWFSKIVAEGYSGQAWAFLPVYPLVVKAGYVLMAGIMPVQVVGTVVSTSIFAAFVWVTARLRHDSAALASGLVPRTRLAWLVFLLSPASYVFSSHHSESLFVFLSLAALVLAARRSWLLAALLGGLASLTRIQGVFLAVALAYWAMCPKSGGRWRPLRFVWSGVVSAAIFALYLVYQYQQTGDGLAFLAAHDVWAHRAIGSIDVVVKGFLIANPWQQHSLGTYLHHAGFIFLLWATWLCRSLPKPIVLYLSLSLFVIPWQGEFVDVFRFGAVLFPALYTAGEHLSVWPTWLRYVVAIGAVALNLAVTYSYAIHRWAY